MDPLSGGEGRFFIGIYHHPPPADTGIEYQLVKETWTTEAIAFASSYAAKTALWLIKFP